MRSWAVRLAVVVPLLISISAPASMGATASTSESEIAWESCPLPETPTQECAAFDVPLDYDEPDGPTIPPGRGPGARNR
jgi:hypothetical protein